MAIQSNIYSTEFGVRSFTSTKHIPTEQHFAVWLQLVSDDSWVQLDINKYDLLNNSAVLEKAPDTSLYKQVEIRVADTPDELTTAPSDITIVAGISIEIEEVASTVVPNITEILQADDNASIATTKASEASTSASNASTSEANASTSESNALSSANIATTQASIATTKAGEASVSASEALASENNASTSASNANDSATKAQATLDEFTGIYHGALATATVGDEGDLYFDTVARKMKVYDGTAWVVAGSSIASIIEDITHIATTGQTEFNATYDVGFAYVYQNGLRLASSDYTATNGTSITLITPAKAGDIIEVVAFGTFEVADTYTRNEVDLNRNKCCIEIMIIK